MAFGFGIGLWLRLALGLGFVVAAYKFVVDLLCLKADCGRHVIYTNVTSAGWQVTLCDPIRHVSFRSGVAG